MIFLAKTYYLWLITFDILICIKAVVKVIGIWFCKSIFKIVKTAFFNTKFTVTICLGRVWIVTGYFIFEKQDYYWLLENKIIYFFYKESYHTVNQTQVLLQQCFFFYWDKMIQGKNSALTILHPWQGYIIIQIIIGVSFHIFTWFMANGQSNKKE